MPSRPARIFSIDEVEQRLDKPRREGKIIVLANGAFDLLHVGHLRYLQGARNKGNILVVAVNSDRSVRRLKGRDRPVFPASERAELLASLRVVDLVAIFDDLTVAGVLERLRPHIHAKGTDYTPDTVPEKDIVRRYGGRTVITGDPKHHSSHLLIKQLRVRHPAPHGRGDSDEGREEER